MDKAADPHCRFVPGVSSIVVVLAPTACDPDRSSGELDLRLAGPASIHPSRWKNIKGFRHDIVDRRTANAFLGPAPRHSNLWHTNAGRARHCHACRLDKSEDTNTSCWARSDGGANHSGSDGLGQNDQPRGRREDSPGEQRYIELPLLLLSRIRIHSACSGGYRLVGVDYVWLIQKRPEREDAYGCDSPKRSLPLR